MEPGLGAADLEPRWWVIHTLSRCEKRMDEWLGRQGWEHYLPLRRRLHVYASKRVEFLHPLFPGYAFGRFSRLERRSVHGSDYAARIIAVEDQSGFLAQLEPIRAVLAQGAALTLCPYLEKGTRVRVMGGRFRGVEGMVQRRSGKARVVLSVDLLQQAVALEVDEALLAIVG
jgi:transcription antitermination factor NusG